MKRFSALNGKGRLVLLLAVLALAAAGCRTTSNDNSDEEDDVRTVTPVTVTHIRRGSISESILLSGKTIFLRKSYVRSTAAGYLTKIAIHVGQEVRAGELLFVLKTKEASALSELHDTALNFSGNIYIKAPKAGIVRSIDHQLGDYVQDADQLCVISDKGSLVFLMDVPFEYHRYVNEGKKCQIILPGADTLPGLIGERLDTMDAAAQTLSYVVRTEAKTDVPENLVVRMNIVKQQKQNAVLLPKPAVLTDETQTSFWIMRLLNDSTAVRTNITKGIETSNEVEIVAPSISDKDRILLSGNYGLPDTALVKIMNNGRP